MSSTSPGLREGQRRLIPKLFGESEEGHTKESARKKNTRDTKGRGDMKREFLRGGQREDKRCRLRFKKKMKERRTRMRKAPGLVPGVRSQ